MPLGYNNDDGAQALDQQQEIDFRRGWQVVDADSGSNVVTAGTGSYDVDVAAGDINTPTGTVTCSAATLDLESLVDPDLPRIVIVYRDASGVAQTLAGTPAAKQPEGETAPGPIYQPAPDAFSTTDGVVLATVLLEAAASSVGGAQIRDRRMPASLNVDSAEVGSLNAGKLATESEDGSENKNRIVPLKDALREGYLVGVGDGYQIVVDPTDYGTGDAALQDVVDKTTSAMSGGYGNLWIPAADPNGDSIIVGETVQLDKNGSALFPQGWNNDTDTYALEAAINDGSYIFTISRIAGGQPNVVFGGFSVSGGNNDVGLIDISDLNEWKLTRQTRLTGFDKTDDRGVIDVNGASFGWGLDNIWTFGLNNSVFINIGPHSAGNDPGNAYIGDGIVSHGCKHHISTTASPEFIRVGGHYEVAQNRSLNLDGGKWGLTDGLSVQASSDDHPAIWCSGVNFVVSQGARVSAPANDDVIVIDNAAAFNVGAFEQVGDAGGVSLKIDTSPDSTSTVPFPGMLDSGLEDNSSTGVRYPNGLRLRISGTTTVTAGGTAEPTPGLPGPVDAHECRWGIEGHPDTSNDGIGVVSLRWRKDANGNYRPRFIEHSGNSDGSVEVNYEVYSST